MSTAFDNPIYGFIDVRFRRLAAVGFQEVILRSIVYLMIYLCFNLGSFIYWSKGEKFLSNAWYVLKLLLYTEFGFGNLIIYANSSLK